jgi:urease accessory protein
MRPVAVATVALASILLAGPAAAHVGIGATSGFWHGVWHPVGGPDHVLAMVAVGMIAAGIGGRALWLVPAAFVAVMAVGGLLGSGGLALPFVNGTVTMSVLVFGITLAARLPIPAALAAVLVGTFALFHGHAHGTEMSAGTSGATYGLGFLVATAALHGLGLAAGLATLRLRPRLADGVMRFTGVATALAGAALLVASQ